MLNYYDHYVKVISVLIVGFNILLSKFNPAIYCFIARVTVVLECSSLCGRVIKVHYSFL